MGSTRPASCDNWRSVSDPRQRLCALVIAHLACIPRYPKRVSLYVRVDNPRFAAGSNRIFCLSPASVGVVSECKRPKQRLTKEFAMTTIATFDGDQFDAYLALPPGNSGPGVVLLQEIFGVNQVMRSIADWY